MRSVRRWVFIINTIRTLSYVNIDDMNLEVDWRRLRLHCNPTDNSLDIIDHDTGEVLMIFSEDGQPDYLTEWANSPMEWDRYDFPMCEHWRVEGLKTIAWSIARGQKVLINYEGRDFTIDTTGEYIEVFNHVTNQVIMKLGYNEEHVYEEE